MALIEQLGIGSGPLQALLEFVGREDAENGSHHRAMVEWMLLGSELGPTLTGRTYQEPTYSEFATLVLLVELRAPNLRRVLDHLAHCCPLSGMLAVQKLVEATEPWAHPSQILESPRPAMQVLWSAYQRRAQEGDKTRAFRVIRDRLENAAGVEMTAERRRRNRVAQMRDARVRVGDGGRIARWILEHLTAMSRAEIVEGLRAAKIPTLHVDRVLYYLGARTLGADTPYRLAKDPTFEALPRAVQFILEQLPEGEEMTMSDLARVAHQHRTQRGIAKASFVAACRWVLDAVHPESSPKELRRYASTCWDGAAAAA